MYCLFSCTANNSGDCRTILPKVGLFDLFWSFLGIPTEYYGNTDCGVFQSGGTKLERFLPKNQHTQRTLLNFENWVDGEVSESDKI